MSAKIRRLVFGIPLMLFIALAIMFVFAIGADTSLLPSQRLGKPFPPFSLTLLQDEQRFITEKDVAGEPALLNVWATWCPTCLYEHSTLNTLATEGVIIYGLNYKDERVDAQGYLARNGNPYRFNIFDENGDLGLDLGVYGAPETYVLDADGYIQYRHVGELTLTVWRDILEPKMSALKAVPIPLNSAEAI